MEFVSKYHSKDNSHKVKEHLRQMWTEAGGDFEMAGMILVAKKTAFKETVTEGSWLSKEQLEDVMKSETHAENFTGFCRKHGLVKVDHKRQCKPR